MSLLIINGVVSNSVFLAGIDPALPWHFIGCYLRFNMTAVPVIGTQLRRSFFL